jgi:hypothetical protein
MDMHETAITIVMVFVFAVDPGLFFLPACRAIRQGVPSWRALSLK